MPKAKLDSVRAYEKRQAEIRELLRDIVCQLQHHARKQKANPDDWGFSGDLANVVTLLREASEAIGGGGK